MEIGDLIKNKRLEKRKPIQYVASKLEVPNDYIQKIEDGKIDPSFGTVKRILGVLGSDFENLFPIKVKEIIKEVEVVKEIEIIKEVSTGNEKKTKMTNEEFLDEVMSELKRYIEMSDFCSDHMKKEKSKIDIHEELNTYTKLLSCEKFFDGQVEGANWAIKIMKKVISENQ